jgi:hypothetical protein
VPLATAADLQDHLRRINLDDVDPLYPEFRSPSTKGIFGIDGCYSALLGTLQTGHEMRFPTKLRRQRSLAWHDLKNQTSGLLKGSLRLPLQLAITSDL